MPSEPIEARERIIYRCPAGHRVPSAEIAARCPYCRRKLDSGILRYFRRMSQEMLKGVD